MRIAAGDSDITWTNQGVYPDTPQLPDGDKLFQSDSRRTNRRSSCLMTAIKKFFDARYHSALLLCCGSVEPSNEEPDRIFKPDGCLKLSAGQVALAQTELDVWVNGTNKRLPNDLLSSERKYESAIDAMRIKQRYNESNFSLVPNRRAAHLNRVRILRQQYFSRTTVEPLWTFAFGPAKIQAMSWTPDVGQADRPFMDA